MQRTVVAGPMNQRFHYLSTTFDTSMETTAWYQSGVETRVGDTGQLLVNGFLLH